MNILAKAIINANNLPQVQANNSTLDTLLTIFFTVLGALAFLMLVISGFRYVISDGEPQKVAEIRRQMIYIAAGLILAAMADVIVTFVLNKAG
jgi:Na+/melibiose symporter-like transporter